MPEVFLKPNIGRIIEFPISPNRPKTNMPTANTLVVYSFKFYEIVYNFVELSILFRSFFTLN